jgi:hypothetical protein
MIKEDLKGGRGKCPQCGQWENNISYHEVWECPERKCLDCGNHIRKCDCADELPFPKGKGFLDQSG